MHESFGNLWHSYDRGYRICITTNGALNSRGECVMGRGIASQAKERFPFLPLLLGKSIKANGNHVYYFEEYDVYSFPVKHHWAEKADLQLIKRSAEELVFLVNQMEPGRVENNLSKTVFLPRPGCGNGKLQWQDVLPLLVPILDSRFIVMEKNRGSL